MSWQVGYPDAFRYLDDEHEDIGVALQSLRGALEAPDERSPKLLMSSIMDKLRTHMAHEEEVMKAHAYPELELHEKHHQLLTETIEMIMQFFDARSMVDHGESIVNHIENKLSEEIFVDHLFADYLRNQAGKS